MLKSMKKNLPANEYEELEIFYAAKKEGSLRSQNTRRIHPSTAMAELRNNHDETFLLPYLDLRSLSEDPTRLLGLLHHRSHSDLEDWVLFDRQQFRPGFRLGALHTAYNPHAVVAYGDRFGQLVQWQEDKAHRWDYIGYPCALQIFQAQSTLSCFLRNIKLLLSKGNKHAGSDHWFEMVAVEFASKERLIGRSAYLKQPYSAPPAVNVPHILEILQSRLRKSSDELNSMQTDPLLFRAATEAAEKHPIFNIDEQTGQTLAPHLPEPVALSVIRSEVWRYLVSEAQAFAQAYKVHRDAVRVGVVLPLSYTAPLLRFEAALKFSLHQLSARLRLILPALSAFKRHFKRSDRGIEGVLDNETAYRTDPLFWNLCQLAGMDTEFSWAFSFHLDKIDQLMANGSNKTKKRLDQ
ncbi:uncharacterized protein LTR77_006998 [Saxophila tyrrhenica]|uniref:Uncharacterized protein n=1 Tax=Saxophila tyrrhenica TaxID=1690608 RepID=A0AAV9PAB9_9PEZI|nr:hypothetical protein LTR77_006998 [Saxophila tyrrhenica]